MTRTPNTDYTKVGDSAFTNGNVISYEGENYYRACNYKVSDKPDGGTTYCVKHVDHRSNPNSLHEDFEGHEVPHGGESNLAQHARRELEVWNDRNPEREITYRKLYSCPVGESF